MPHKASAQPISLSHPLQTDAWMRFRKAMGVDVVKTRDGYISFHHIPHTPWTIGYFPKGTLPTKETMRSLLKIGKEKRAIFIQLEPNVLSDFKFQILNFKLLRPSHRPLFTKYTFVLDLTKSEEDIVKNMHPKTRYNIRLAQRHGVTIREDNSNEAFARYLALTRETTGRQGFYAHNERYHTTMWRIMREAGIAHLFTATHQDKTLAAWIVFVHNNTVYYPYGASSRENREVMAPTLLLWEIAQWAKKRGLKNFDLWGSLGPNPDRRDPWFGFHRFKQGFNPALVEFIGSYDLVIRPFFYRLYTVADSLRWSLLSFKRILSH